MDDSKLIRTMKCTSVLFIIFGACCWASPLRLSDTQMKAVQEHVLRMQEQAKEEATTRAADFFKEICNNGADKKAEQRFAASVGEVITCTQLESDEIRSIIEAEDLLHRGAEISCEKYSSSKQCFGKFIDSMSICEMNIELPLEDLKNTIYEIVNYTCAGGSSKMEALMKELQSGCAQSLNSDMASCLGNLQSLNSIESFTWSDGGCRLVEEVEECTGGIFKRCGGVNTTELVDGIFAITRRGLPCGRRRA